MAGLIGRISSGLAAATSARKCHACGCFQDAVDALRRTDLASSLATALAEAESVFANRGYDCLGCDVCWPANVLNIAAEMVDLPAGKACPTDAPDPTGGWPPFPGDYRVIRFTAPVAVCTLQSSELVGEIARNAPEGLSIVGPLQTENLGIERLVANVVSNPNLRFLVLCGEDTTGAVGHFPGHTLLAFASNGADHDGRIHGARGKRPLLKNLDRAVLSHFREVVEVIDAIGVRDASRVVRHVEDCALRDPGPAPDSPAVERRVDVLQTKSPAPLVPDPSGYFLVMPDRRRGVIVAEHYGNDGVLRTVVEGARAVDLASTIVREELVKRLDHAAYLGRELTRAEFALTRGTPYVQDRAPDIEREDDGHTDGAARARAGSGPGEEVS